MIGIIGGTGFTSLISGREEILDTPYGRPSSKIVMGNIGTKEVAFISRHGQNHVLPPHKVPHKANILALKHLGCEQVISICAAGSLKKEYAPGHIVIPDQYIDFTGILNTFHHGPEVYHVSMADPFCNNMRGVIVSCLQDANIGYHDKGTYLMIKGPRFSTRAESRMYKKFADLIGMTGVTESALCREQELCSCMIAMISDYDVWSEKPVDAQKVKETVSKNIGNVKELLNNAIERLPLKRTCTCRNSLKNAKI